MTFLSWLPPAADFRADLRAALDEANPAGSLERLGQLSRHRLGYLETLQLDRPLDRLVIEPPQGWEPIRLALAGSATLDHLRPGIRVAGLRRRLALSVHVAPYGQFRQVLLDLSSGLYRFRPQFVLLSLTAREAIAGIPLSAGAAQADAALSRFVDGLRALWERARVGTGATVIQQTFMSLAEPLFGSYDRQVPAAPSRLVARLNDLVAEAALSDGVLLVDAARAAERDGVLAWHDSNRWLQAKMEIAPAAVPMYGELVARVIAAQRGASKKCLVLDLDNTLWGGVIGDDGLDGIVLGEGSPVGEAHLALQRYAKSLLERGIILAVCSKNDPAIAQAAFEQHPEMALKRADIAAFVANWEDKATNLKRIAEQLNIGVDSLVFVDDNPAERARIRQALPAVAVPELPADPGQYVRCVAEAGYFETVTFTAEDRERGRQYAANASRDEAQRSAESIEDFLRSLEMRVGYGPITPVELARSTQLINKTNQFNLTTRRYTPEEVGQVMASTEDLTFQLRLEDRFGDNGLVSVILLRPAVDEAGVLEIDTWVMSCRVFGRQLEQETMNIVVEAARRRGIRALRGNYLPTAKNGVVSGLYATLGFEQVAGAAPAEGGSRWRLELDRYAALPTFITRSSHPDD